MKRTARPPLMQKLSRLLTQLGIGSVLLILLLIAGGLLIGFVRLAWTEHQINQSIARQEAANAAQRRTNDQLKGQAEYSESDMAIEQAARERLGMAREGETVLRPNIVAAPTAAPPPTETLMLEPSAAPDPVPQSATAANAQGWWRALFPRDPSVP